MEPLLSFLQRLDEAPLHYLLGSYRDAVTVHVAASANERWEIDFFPNGTVEVERFVSTGGVEEADDALLDSLFRD